MPIPFIKTGPCLIFVLCTLLGAASAHPCRPDLIPNGGKFTCDSCHVIPGGPRNPFGKAVEALVMRGSCDPFWGPTLAAGDADEDDIPNGLELGDPDGTWSPGAPAPGFLPLVSNPGVPDERIQIQLEEVASGLTAPVAGAHAGDGSKRLFIVEQEGRIRVIENGQLRTQPFLDLEGKVLDVNPSYDERGLLGLAFHPDYASNGRFFVYYSRAGGTGNHTSVVAEYLVSGDPNLADPLSEQVILEIPQPEFNHNGGTLAFGPDGMLYIGVGDGGGANDQHGVIGNGQDLETLLGKILRIDIDLDMAVGEPYEIPTDNPFVGVPGLDEIWAYGLRNPWKFSFDRGGERRLFCADVGQNLWEEVDIIVRGGNYGWRVMEGTHCFNPPSGCDTTGKILPIAEYNHSVGVSVTGGHVYRGGRYPILQGKYVFGDFSAPGFGGNGKLFYLEETSPQSWQIFEFISNGDPGSAFGPFILGFAEDEDGELYVLGSTSVGPSGTGGTVHRITVPVRFRRGDCSGDRTLGLSDVIGILMSIFSSESRPFEVGCRDACDWNDDGKLNLVDAISGLRFLFTAERLPMPALPYPDCGTDTTPSDLTCERYDPGLCE